MADAVKAEQEAADHTPELDALASFEARMQERTPVRSAFSPSLN